MSETADVTFRFCVLGGGWVSRRPGVGEVDALYCLAAGGMFARGAPLPRPVCGCLWSLPAGFWFGMPSPCSPDPGGGWLWFWVFCVGSGSVSGSGCCAVELAGGGSIHWILGSQEQAGWRKSGGRWKYSSGRSGMRPCVVCDVGDDSKKWIPVDAARLASTGNHISNLPPVHVGRRWLGGGGKERWIKDRTSWWMLSMPPGMSPSCRMAWRCSSRVAWHSVVGTVWSGICW